MTEGNNVIETKLETRIMVSIFLVFAIFLYATVISPMFGGFLEQYAFQISITLLLFVLGVTYYFIRNVGSSLTALASFTTALAKGDFDAQLKTANKNSIGQRLFTIQDVRILEESTVKMKSGLKNMIHELRQKESETAYLLNALGTPVFAIDTDYNITMANEAAAQAAGVQREDLIGRKCYHFFNTPHCNTEECRTSQAMRFKESRKGETVVNVNGKQIPISYKATPLFDKNGEVTGAVEYTVNLSDQYAKQRELEKKENELIEIFKKFPQPGYVYFIDTEGTVKYTSEAFANDFVGKSASDLIGKKLSELIGVKTVAEKVIDSGRPVIGNEGKAKTKDGKLVPLLVSGIPIKLDGEVIGALGFLVDITEQKKLVKYMRDEVSRILPVMEAAANGDLTQELEVKNDDDFGKLIKAFNQMRDNLRNIVINITETSNYVSSASEELTASIEEISNSSRAVADSAQKIAAGADEQTTSLESSNKALEEISGITEETASNAENVLEIAQGASSLAVDGYDASATAIRNMDELAASNAEVKKEVEELERRAEKIGEIVDVITTIAEQTSLLALNANIEAARVGEQGRGFAVVAGEVGKLANETQESARNISELIKEIQDSMSKLVESVKDSNEKTEGTVKAVSDVMERIERIKESIQDTVVGMEEIKKAMDDQANAVQGLAVTSDKVFQVAVSNTQEIENTAAAAEEQATSVDEISKSSEDLANMADRLISMVNKFKLN